MSMPPYFIPICSTLNSAPSQFAASSLHRQWVFSRNRTQPVHSHSVVHTLVFFKPPSCWKIYKYKISLKTLSRYLRNGGNGSRETPRHLWEVPMAGDAGIFEDYLWELLFYTWRSLLSLLWFGNSLYLIQGALWAGSSSLRSSNSSLGFFTLILVFYQAVPVPSQFLPLGVLIVYKCKIYLYFAVNSSICPLHYFKHQWKYLPYVELWQYWGLRYFYLSFVIMQLQCLPLIFISYLIYALLA